MNILMGIYFFLLFVEAQSDVISFVGHGFAA